MARSSRDRTAREWAPRHAEGYAASPSAPPASPPAPVGLAQGLVDALHPPGLDQRAELEVHGVHVGVPAGEVAEAAVGVPAAEGPIGGPGDGPAHLGRVPAELPQDEDRVVAG